MKGPGSEGRPSRLAIPTSDGIVFVNYHDIIHLRADGSYTHVHCVSGIKYMLSTHLHALEVQLPASTFFRCHHSHLVNLREVRQLFSHAGYRLLLSSSELVEVSRRRWMALLIAMRRL